MNGSTERERRIDGMGVFKCKETGTWYVMTRYRAWKEGYIDEHASGNI